MLAKSHRLKKKKDFERVLKKGKSRQGEFLIFKSAPSKLASTRVGIVVPKRVAQRATARNKIKRQLRGAVMANLAKIKPGYDLIFLADKGSGEKEAPEFKKAVGKLLAQAKLLKENKIFK